MALERGIIPVLPEWPMIRLLSLALAVLLAAAAPSWSQECDPPPPPAKPTT
jgi:hypothetical protein